MDNLNNIPNVGNWGDAASKLNDNFNKVKQAVTTVENTSKNNKGYFTSLSALNTAFPSPRAGLTAYVYDEESSTNYYIYNAVNGAWVASSIEAPSVGVDISEYTKTGGSTKTTKEIDDIKANHGYDSSPKTLKEIDDIKANHGYDSSPKTLKDVEDDIAQVVEKGENEEFTHLFVDEIGVVLASIDQFGNFRFFIDESQKQYLLSDLSSYLSESDIKNINLIKKDTDEEYIFKLADAEDKIIFSIDKNGLTEGYFKNNNPAPASNVNFTDILVNKIPIENGIEYEVESKEIIVDKISLPTIAVGRESSEGADDAPTIPLTNKGLTHPSVVYAEGGWNGWKYWLVFTPYFNPVPGSEYENPHILVSNDGETFQEPDGISNPIDRVNASPRRGYWSDTHLKLGDDGCLHLWYRGNFTMIDEVEHSRVYVHRRSRDGVNWSDRTITYTTNEGVGIPDNLCLSPAFLKNGTKWLLYDVFKVIDGDGLQIVGNTTNNQTRKFVMRRMSDRPDKDYEDYNADQVVNFKNRPWGVTNDVWHLDVQEFGNGFFALLAVGDAEGGGSESLWLAYSGDGWNFTVIDEPLMATFSYRSCMVFKGYEEGKITLDVYAGNRYGEIQLQKLILKKK